MATTHPHFNDLISESRIAILHAQAMSDACDTPVCVWERGGWFVISDMAPESFEECGFAEPESQGWTLYAVVDPFYANV